MAQLPSRKNVRRGTVSALAATLTLSAAACGGNLSGGGDGEAFPQGPVTLMVGQDAGGSTDLIARALAEGASDELGVAMPVVNTPGANGALAANEISGEKPDGQNLLLINASLTAITPLAVPDGAIDINDFTVVTGVSRDDYVLVTASASELDTLQDLIDSDDELKFGTTGVGTGSQLSQELLFEQAEIAGTAVPFDGGSPTMTAVLGEQVDVAAIQLGEAIGQIEGGELVPLLTFSDERNQYLPDVPTADEEGYDVQVSQYRAVVAPKGTPEATVERLREAFTAAFGTEQYDSFNEANLLTAHEVGADQVIDEWAGYRESYQAMIEEYGIDLSEEQ
ncbi:tripartite tricarboxylate transporter substrate binding protein [Actinorugispora endophytica]|uniref:Tripartite-type tricarboxylate transporter receptor subunit TctC n=1 Tax=Actinorugispora endophytica TaxID=1605990 RepID=A0A4R6V042_9ACTN|nr:tripartite tricarboxylate transporter substrate binding protein [Actinorugispora endophytica]TDQ53045.1 tripartite-type tricarboxylate transporter receptor subunit TctC [Actinorugispora endophytica]